MRLHRVTMDLNHQKIRSLKDRTSVNLLSETMRKRNSNLLNALRGQDISTKRSAFDDMINANARLVQNGDNYSAVKAAASGLQDHVSKLADGREDSLFDAAKEKNDTGDVVTEVERFVADYNAMIDGMRSTGGSVNSIFLSQLRKHMETNGSSLKEIGITQGADGRLAVNQDKLKSASIDKLESLFGKDNGFAGQVSAMSTAIQANAEMNISICKAYDRSFDGGYGSYEDYFGGFNSRI